MNRLLSRHHRFGGK